ncbi:uncharacterized protein CANTADRAFT_33421, partial [Suhomyces tanzawaensis NRRL Y-17324]
SSKRILGSPFKSPQQDSSHSKNSAGLQHENDSFVEESPTPIRPNSIGQDDDNSSKQALFQSPGGPESGGEEIDCSCPMCGESMVNLYQLNRHIDDAHGVETTDSTNAITKLMKNDFINNDIKKWFSSKIVDSPTPVSPLKRKSLNLDLFDNNKGFGLSDGEVLEVSLIQHARSQSSSPSKYKNRIIRSHWKLPSSTSRCSYPGCDKTLNVRNGIVNCRKCGQLFCNDHTHHKIRLRNPVKTDDDNIPQYDTSKNGVWSRSCISCYNNKPDLREGTVVNSNDLTKLFIKKRQEKVDHHELERSKIIKRFIKLSNTLIEKQLQEKQSLWSSLASAYTKDFALFDHDDWDDNSITNCTICLVKFNLLIRKHHCRLCGKIVCDDPQGMRKKCSILVPLSKLLEKLPTLNYSSFIKDNFDTVTQDELVRFRCCVNCKNSLLYEYKIEHLKSDDDNEVLKRYEILLMMKSQVQNLYLRYEQLLGDSSLGSDENINKVRNKLMKALKDFEGATITFKNEFFALVDNKLQVKQAHQGQSRLINNMYQSLILCLQEVLMDFKTVNNKVQQQEEKKLKEAQEKSKNQVMGELEKEGLVLAASEPERDAPRLTKKQIRELREQLMVMNEQKFLVDNMIQDFTKLRKFDELDSLINNKNELSSMIEELEKQLGDYGF